jgi:hypothetical protein
MRSRVEHRLLSLPPPNSASFSFFDNEEVEAAESSRDLAAFVYEGSKIAALIYVNFVLREFGPGCGVLSSLKGRIMEGFDVLNIQKERKLQGFASPGNSTTDEKNFRVLLWILCMTSLVALNEKERQWFRERIANIINITGMESYEQLR